MFPIIVRKTDPANHEGDKGVEEPYVLVDGGRRYLATKLAARLEGEDGEKYLIEGREAETIEVKVVDNEKTSEARYVLELEFHANEDREGFSWKEKASYVERIHEMLMEEYGDRGWTIEHTANYLKMGKTTVFNYLKLSEDPEILEDERVSGAKTFRTAHKQAEILREKKRRERAVKHHKKVTTDSDSEQSPDEKVETAALRLVANEDCREWIRKRDDESASWIHWDPPYGGDQDGGAFSAFEGIDDTPEYADELLEAMLPELFRVLQPGRWLAIWFHPARYASTKEALERAGFWVNPYPCIWYKQDRNSDGHEIRRYLVNAYECFFLCSKGDDGILQFTNRQNVLPFDVITKGHRRHIMHKPKDMLIEILKIISIPGEHGLDPSVGSGSIFEAALTTGRICHGCELSTEYWLGSIEAIKNTIGSLGIK
jgi:DNA modification methylase